jgi:bacterioferritin-associated ferredoxin
MVCLCNLVDEKEILSWLKKGANSTKEIQQFTLSWFIVWALLT